MLRVKVKSRHDLYGSKNRKYEKKKLIKKNIKSKVKT